MAAEEAADGEPAEGADWHRFWMAHALNLGCFAESKAPKKKGKKGKSKKEAKGDDDPVEDKVCVLHSLHTQGC